jgi:muskelin
MNTYPSQPTRLSYSIAGCSEHSNRYVAENIMVDAPTDANSRWSGLHEDPTIKQWILLRLDTLSVIGEFLG